MTPDWIFSLESQELQQKASQFFAAGNSTLQVIKKLRAEAAPELVSQVIELHELRIRGQQKFTQAAHMYFTRQQLEQATSEVIARYKSRRFEECNSVADLCCGIGGDAIALAKISNLSIVDLDPLILQMAQQNVKAYEARCSPLLQPAEEFHVASIDSFHLDPDRRHEKSGGKPTRSTHTDYFSPTTEQIKKLAQSNPNFGVKLAPATQAWEGDFEIEFIGHQRECKQQMVWSGRLAHQVGVRATVLDNAGQKSESFSVPHLTSRTVIASPPSKVKSYLFDPHASLLAAGLLPEFAESASLQILSSDSLYLTADQSMNSMLVSGFEVLEVLKPNMKSIESYLRSLNTGVLEVKQRGKHFAQLLIRFKN